ncbi:MAG: FadR family transcriptional regulator [Planctomycetaceae bacterium]|nr:FadR family transcriptional regulator [Planctomycetaceae bacterium]
MLDPLKKKTRLYEDIVRQFMQKIDDGELKAGDKLPTERELVEQLGVSRSSIREALRAMELLGVVQSKVGGGTFIKHSRIDRNLLQFADTRQDDKTTLLETFEVRMVLEAYSAAQAAKKRTDEQLVVLRESIDEMTRDIEEGNRGSGADMRFHRIIAEMAGNSMLLNVLTMIAGTLTSSIAVSNAHVDSRDIVAEHREMYEAIAAGDDKAAERLMRAHLKRAHQRVTFLLAEGAMGGC